MRLHIFTLLVIFSVTFLQSQQLNDSATNVPDSQQVFNTHLSLDIFAGDFDEQKIYNLISFIDTLEDDSIRKEAFLLFRMKRNPNFIPLLNSYKTGLLYTSTGKLWIYSPQKTNEGSTVYQVIDAMTGEVLNDVSGNDSLSVNTSGTSLKATRGDRNLINEIILGLSLYHTNREIQKESFIKAADMGNSLFLNELLAASNICDPKNRTYYTESIARLQILYGNENEKFSAVEILGKIGSIRAIASLEAIVSIDTISKNSMVSTPLQSLAQKNIRRANTYQKRIAFIKSSFSGLSLGSILILLALGLSVIFGLMGVINMAHGEFMMLGAFTTYVICEFFKAHVSPQYFDYYYLVAIPASFSVSFIIGWICESLLIRKLYGRPFETILATWGLSLILIQTVRVIFGDTLSLTPPGWLSGGWEIIPDLVLPTNRIFIIFYCTVSISGFYFLVNKTRLGLLLRASAQDRQTASSLGVSVRKIDGVAFALGAGMAGLAGAAVPLFDKINPGMGQSYIVDSFMVVVVGGVGNLGGSIFGGLGLGFLTKYIEPFLGAVYGKVTVLIIIVLFLQSRPSGLFPSKGRSADD